MKKVRPDTIWEMLANICVRMFCLPPCCLKKQILKYTELGIHITGRAQAEGVKEQGAEEDVQVLDRGHNRRHGKNT